MNTSPEEDVRNLYENTADSYAKMMDAEIDLPVYADTLGRLADRIADIPGPVVDTSCGSGHMLARYHEQYDPDRMLMGIDLSPRMVDLTRKRLGATAKILTGDMRDLSPLESESSAAVLSFFAIHHLGPDEVLDAFTAWHRVLQTGGQLLVATWEGQGAIDYGDSSDVVALRYSREEIIGWSQKAGFTIDRCVVEPVEEIPMDAIYLEGTKR